MPSTHELLLVAAIPEGHDVLVVTFALADQTATLVLDRTASILYSPEVLWGALHQNGSLAVKDPIAVVTRWSWTVRSVVEGICAGAIVSTKSWGDFEVKTILLVEPATTPYR